MADVVEPRNAFWRREQLQRWNESDTNKVTAEPKRQELVKVKFQDGCVFLAACSSGDNDEVKRLLARGADINTANIDGLTALHQACIDDNLQMVQFLVELGAEIDACDNEGWTPLHATASCDFLDIAKFLIEKGASVSTVNSDGELPIDIADSDEMEQLLYQEMERQGVDADGARQEEEEIMLSHANQWLSSKHIDEVPHPKTGATSLHVAAAKGYSKVMSLLIEAGANCDAKDHDGWTPLHAAAHWGQEDACKILIENFCNMDEKNLVGQTPLDIAEPNLVPFLEDLRKTQATLKKDRDAKMQEKIVPRPAPLKRRSSVTRMSVDQKQSVILKNVEEERQHLEAMRQKHLVESEEKTKTEEASSESSDESSESETEKRNNINIHCSVLPTAAEIKNSSDKSSVELEKSMVLSPKIEEAVSPLPDKTSPTPGKHDIAKPKELLREAEKEKSLSIDHVDRVTGRETKMEKKEREDSIKKDEMREADKTVDVKHEETEKDKFLSGLTGKPVLLHSISVPLPSTTLTSGGRQMPSFAPKPLASKTERTSMNGPASWRAGLRKTGSSSAVPETVLGNKEESDRLARSASSPWLAPNENYSGDVLRRRPFSTSSVGDQYVRNISTATTLIPFQSSYVPLSRRRQMEQEENQKKEEKEQSSLISNISVTSPTSTAVRRSFEPPKRDEERETERKAKARKARETRRSTQGVTKEDLEMAEKTLIAASKGSEPPAEDKSDKENKPVDYSSIRRRAWEDKKEDDKSSFRKSGLSESGAIKLGYLQRMSSSDSGSSSNTVNLMDTTTTNTISAYRSSYRTSKYLQNEDDKDDKEKKEDKEDPSQKSSAIRTRRKRENRRPTGKITLEDIQGVSEDGEKQKEDKKEDDPISSRFGQSRYSDSLGSSSVYDRTSTSSYQSRAERPTSFAGYSRPYKSASLPDKESDYKKLYEEEKNETEKLKKEVKKLQHDLSEAKVELEKSRLKNDSSKTCDSSTDKRERRALERKLSELEEELKSMENLKADNQRLKDENGALIRVISKLSK